MRFKPERRLIKDGLNEAALRRRDFIKLGLTGAALSCINSGCENKTSANPPDRTEQVYELTDGQTLYDDFDGNGNLQTYNNQNLAEPGRLSSKLWDTSQGTEVVRNPGATGLLTVVNEDGQPYPGSKRLLWVGAQNGRCYTENGSFVVQKGVVYGSARIVPAGGNGWVLRLNSSLPGLMGCFLAHPRDIAFADMKTLSADVMVPSTSTAKDFYAALDYHTTIPEQPPGKSWFTDIGIRRYASGDVYAFAQSCNVNAGYRSYLHLEQAKMDTWYNLRQDVITRKDDPSLKDNEFRIDYYVNGILRGSEIPEDAELLLDPMRTGWGPNRLLIIYAEQAEGKSIGFFDNVRAAYNNRVI